GKVRIDRVVKCDGDKGESKLSMRKKTYGMRDSAQSDFNRYGDLFLDFLRRSSGEQRNHLDLGVRHVRKSFHRESTERSNACSNKKANQQCQEKRLVQGEGNDSFDHDLYFVSRRLLSSRTPLVTTRSFGPSPSSTTVY